jgi:RNA polymerase sigma-70 factor (ECF subfamily)
MCGSHHPEREQLLRQARQGDQKALERLLDQYRNYLSVLARLQVDRRLQAKVDDSDLVQETFLRACRDFPRFRGTSEAELIEWLRKIMACESANFVRHYFGTQARNVRLEQQIQDELDQSSAGIVNAFAARDSSPSQKAARRERAKLLADALQKLPDDYREVMILHHLEGLTMAEVAGRMGRSDDAVRKLWSRAIIRLRQLLKASV